MVFYRKYRPQTIDELDSAPLRRTLTAVLSKEIPHAFLFTGPKGLGKTSTARIVAKVINCERPASGKLSSGSKKKLETRNSKLGTNVEPCNTCAQCVSITNGTNMDVLEIDAASNRGIDEIRDLREKIRLAPLTATKKVYIIDEVHMLTTEAFNALLKILEEPPNHAMFILCTTEPHKVPATIVSRCFHIAFKLATEEELIRAFERVVKGEKLRVDKDALQIIAKRSDGGFRDGTKILEELALRALGQDITAEFIETHLQVGNTAQHAQALIAELVRKDGKKALTIVVESVSQGLDPRLLHQQVIERLHNALLVKAGVLEIDNLGFEIEGLDTLEIKTLLELLIGKQGMNKNVVIAQLPLELVIVEWCDTNEKGKTKNENNVNEEDQEENVRGETAGLSPARYNKEEDKLSLATVRKQVGNMAKIKALYGDTTEKITKQDNTDTIDISLLHFSANGEITKEWIDVFWRSMILQMKTHNHTVAGVLRGCAIKSFDRKSLIIETAFKFHKERLDEIQTRTLLQDVCRELTGSPIAVSIVLKAN